MTLRNIVSFGRGNAPANRQNGGFYSLQDEMNRLFRDFMGNDNLPSLEERGMQGIESPSVDIIEGDNNIKVEADLPGLESKDIDISINDNYLTIRGEKSQENKEENENYISRERSYGSFQRTVLLPETVDEDKAQASFKKGVLTITIPKREEAKQKTKKIEVQEEAA